MMTEDIDHQLMLLNIHRKTLRIQMNQLRILGAHTPPGTIYGIQETRKSIGSIKNYLRSHNVDVQDQQVDTTDDWEREFGVE